MKFLVMICLFIALFNEMEANPVAGGADFGSTSRGAVDRADSSKVIDAGVEEGDSGDDDNENKDEVEVDEGAKEDEQAAERWADDNDSVDVDCDGYFVTC